MTVDIVVASRGGLLIGIPGGARPTMTVTQLPAVSGFVY